LANKYNECIPQFKNFEHFKSKIEEDQLLRDKKYGTTYFDLLEEEIIEDERILLDLVSSYTQVRETLDVNFERLFVLQKCQNLMSSNTNSNDFG